MIIPIYELAMYEIIEKIISDIPSKFSFGPSLEREAQKKLLEELFEYTDNLQKYFPDIDSNTYCMIVCATIMQSYLFEINYWLNNSFFCRLKSPFANDQTKSYFMHINKAIDVMSGFYYFDTHKEIIEWPLDFSNAFTWQCRDEYLEEFNQELLAAIDDNPSYPYAYCLIANRHIGGFSSLSFDFNKSNFRYKKAFVKTPMMVGDDLFEFLLCGNFPSQNSKYSIVDGQVKRYDDIAKYAIQQGYSADRVGKTEIKDGCFVIKSQMVPAGIPFYRHFEDEDYDEFIMGMIDYILQEHELGTELYPPILDDNSFYRLEIKQYPKYRGLFFNMPAFDKFPLEALSKLTINHLIKKLLDVSASELDRLDEANNKLEKANEELRQTNDSLSKHIKLNEELVRSLSHSSANYLNSERLTQTGIELHTARVGKPTLDRLHYDGLLLLLQSEHETYLRRRLDSLVIRCQANGNDLKKNIIEGLAEESGETIMLPFDYAVKTIISRLVTRDDDIRSSIIKEKFSKSSSEWGVLRDSFISDVLANNQSAIQWCNQNLCQIKYTLSEYWQKLRLIEDRTFFDLIVEIITELFFNALSHGEVNQPICMEFGQTEETIKRMGRKTPVWCYVKCENAVGERYKGGKQTGLDTLHSTLMLINDNERGIERTSINNRFVTKAWLESSLW